MAWRLLLPFCCCVCTSVPRFCTHYTQFFVCYAFFCTPAPAPRSLFAHHLPRLRAQRWRGVLCCLRRVLHAVRDFRARLSVCLQTGVALNTNKRDAIMVNLQPSSCSLLFLTVMPWRLLRARQQSCVVARKTVVNTQDRRTGLERLLPAGFRSLYATTVAYAHHNSGHGSDAYLM